jgi:ribosome-binding factor A
MAREYNRTDRIADHLRRELATLIQQGMRDPRLAMVSVTDVEVSKDLAHARVFYTTMDADSTEAAAEVTEALNRAAGFMRSQLSRDSSLRTVPQLRFRFDNSVGRGREMEELIEKAVSADRKAGE